MSARAIRRRRARRPRRGWQAAGLAVLLPLAGLGAAADADGKTFVVKNGRASGHGSLSLAVVRSNREHGADRIVFDGKLGGRIHVHDDLEPKEALTIVGRGAKGPVLVGRRPGKFTPYVRSAAPLTLRRIRSRSLGVETSGHAVIRDSRFAAKPRAAGEAIGLESGEVSGTTVTGWEYGIGVAYGSARVSHSTITGNRIGVDVNEAAVDIRRSTVARNGTGLKFGSYSSADVVESRITGNSRRGGIRGYYYAHLEVNRSTIARNAAASGGGIAIGGGSADILNSTISGNEARGGADHPGRGGGIYGAYDADIDVTASTITGNHAEEGGGISVADPSTGEPVSVRSSIVAGNAAPAGPDCSSFDPHGAPPAFSAGGNVFGADGCGTAEPTDVLASNPGLGPVKMNGGPTATHSLRKGSPAIGNALKPGPKTDQRGVERGRNPDSGSFERR